MVGVELPPEVIAGFVSEARRYLPLMVESLAALQDEAKLAEAYRFAHIIKSSAAMLGHIGLSQVAELLEGDLEAFQLGEPATPRHLAQLARSIERIGRLLDAVAGEAVDVDAIIEAEVADRTALLDGPDAFAGDAAGDDAAEADESADADADDDAGAYESMAVDDGTAASRYAS